MPEDVLRVEYAKRETGVDLVRDEIFRVKAQLDGIVTIVPRVECRPDGGVEAVAVRNDRGGPLDVLGF